jgi:hypothetical protein
MRKNELKVLFSSDEFARKPVHHLLKFMQDNQLQVAFKEISGTYHDDSEFYCYSRAIFFGYEENTYML